MGMRNDGSTGNTGGSNTSSGGDPLFENDKSQDLGNTQGGNSATGGSAGSGDPNNNAQAGSPPISIPENWKDILPPEYRDAAWLKNIPDVPALVKSHANVQKMVGAEKIPLPGKHATPDEWRAVYHKLGLPEKVEEYKLEIDPKYKEKVDDTFVKSIAAKAHEAGVLPTQAKQLVEWFAEENEKAYTESVKQAEVLSQKELSDLKVEWGAAYQERVNQAKAAMKDLGDENLVKFIRESGLGKNANFIRIMAKFGEMRKEDTITSGEGVGSDRAYSPNQARQMIDEIKRNLNGPYYNRDHPEHEKIKKQMSQLYMMAFPVKEA